MIEMKTTIKALTALPLALIAIGGCASAKRVANRPVFNEPVEPASAPGHVRAAMTKSRVTPTELEYEWQITGDRAWSTTAGSASGFDTLSGSTPMPGWERQPSSVRIRRLYIRATHRATGDMDISVEETTRTPLSRAAIDVRDPGTVNSKGSSSSSYSGLAKMPLSRLVRVHLAGVVEKPLPASIHLADLDIPAPEFAEVVVSRQKRVRDPKGKVIEVLVAPTGKDEILRKHIRLRNGEMPPGYADDPELRRLQQKGHMVSGSWGMAHKSAIGFEVKP